MKNVLAFSSSRVGGDGYLQNAAPVIKDFLGGTPRRIAFIPFASVDDYADYGRKVSEGLSALPHELVLVSPQGARQTVEGCDAVMVGGGNTFKLLHGLYETDLVDLIKSTVQAGMPYIGWSAGSNLCGPTLRTTNDMPIVQPKSFESFGFFPFQINPHYHNHKPEDFHGETRDQRLEEFLKLNEDQQILALPEGTYLRLQNGQLLFDGLAQGIRMTREDGQTVHYVINPGMVIG